MIHISDTVLVAIIASIPGILAAIFSLRNNRAIKDVHLILNSRLDQLVRASEDAGRIAERSDIASGVQFNPPDSVKK
jgi:hypothetical protein